MDTTVERFQDPEEYRQALLKCYLAVQFIIGLPLDKLADAQSHAETMGPILDPTAWMRNHDKLREDSQVVTALRKAVRALPEEFVATVRLRSEAESKC